MKMKDTIAKDLGNRLKEARTKKKLTQFQLYEKTGISTTQISAYENGNKNIGLNSLTRIALALGVSCDELLFGPNYKRPITNATDEGQLIVACIAALFDRGGIGKATKEKWNDSVPSGTEYFYHICFFEHLPILNDLIIKLDDFEKNKEDYPNPDELRNQFLAAAAKKINEEIKERDEQERQRAEKKQKGKTK